MLCFFRYLFLAVLVTTVLAIPASAVDFLGDVIATSPQKYGPASPPPDPSLCPSGDYIEHVDDYLVCRVDYGAPGQGAYTKLCTVDLFSASSCVADSQVANTALLQANVAANFTYDRMLTATPASAELQAMGITGPLRLTSTDTVLDVQNSNDFFLIGTHEEHRIYRGGKAVLWHEDAIEGLVQLAAYDIETIVLIMHYDTLESSIEATAVRTSGLPIFPGVWNGELLGGGDFTDGSAFGDFPTSVTMELEVAATPSLGGLGRSAVFLIVIAGGWLLLRRRARTAAA